MLDQHDESEHNGTQELPRVELLRIARSLHVSDADVMTRAELRAAIDKARRPEQRPKALPVTWVSVARRLIASIVEQGLHLPDAAALIRGDTTLSAPPKAPPPVATVTLARIYAAQGHLARAISTVDEVLATDSDHDIARDLREQLRKRLEDERHRNENGSPAPHGAPPAVDTASTTGAEAPAASAPLSVEPAPLSVEPAPLSVEPAPLSVEPAPLSVEPAPLSVEPAPPPEPAPRSADLVIIETDGARAYVYWELPWPRSAPSNEPHWISVVAHTPAPFGCEREERRYPVHHESGVIRLEGLPRASFVRAKLTRESASDATPLAVAGSVRASSLELLSPGSPHVLEPRFTPHSRANPKALASRALAQVEGAGPAYW